jgi:hypothetical protein
MISVLKAKSLNRTVSEARVMSMQQLGLLAHRQKDCTRDDDAFAAASEALTAGYAAEPWQKNLGRDGIGKLSPVLYPLRGCCLGRKAQSLK